MSLIEKHMDWFEHLLNARMNHYFENQDTPFSPPPPPHLDLQTPLGNIFSELKLDWREKAIVLLALAPHLRPQALDIFFTSNAVLNRGYTEFGGLKGKNHSGFLPTKETAVFLVAATDMTARIKATEIVNYNHPLFKQQILESEAPPIGEPELGAPLNVTKTFLSKVLLNQDYHPEFGAEFPAKKIETKLNWQDLVLSPQVLDQINDIKAWIKHENLIQDNWGLSKWIKPGYRSLFYGPPGTGKTLTASLIGKEIGRDVYRIDLAMVISKYIGETEKNLAKVFDLAEHSNWILFFDEADALFGKRSLTKSSNDRYANQEVSYLLQRIEDFDGVVILASNFKGNLDEAFMRRFQSTIYFPKPDTKQRLSLWKKALDGLSLDGKIDMQELAEKFEVTGGEIINVIRYAAIQAAKHAQKNISLKDIINGLRKEFHKMGKTLGL